jgi:HlyD family secretion protein
MTTTAKLFVAAIALGGFVAYQQYTQEQPDTQPARFKTQPVDRGDIQRVISANGTLNPTIQVSVGTQVSGTVKLLHVDFNSRVKAGQVLAELDPSLLEAAAAQSRANLASAQAQFAVAQSKFTRSKQLFQQGFISQAELDADRQQLDVTTALVKTTQAKVRADEVNLRYSIIRSPIDGVVVARNVDVGQTVAASFQTPTLFLIAKDLRQMQIDTNIAEADIGAIRVGLPVKFTVDAFADREFRGAVRQIRINPSVQQNVVSYNVVVGFDNDSGVLLPGMTGHVKILAEKKINVIRVPNAALRFKPQDADDAQKQRKGGNNVYRLENGAPQPVRVKTGITDNFYTEVISGELKPGESLIVRENNGDNAKSGNFKLRMF